MKNQTLNLLQMMERCHRSGKFLAVTSNKGDLDKINIAAYQTIHTVASGKKAPISELLISAVRQQKPVLLAYPRAGITLSVTDLAAQLNNIVTKIPSNDKFFKSYWLVFLKFSVKKAIRTLLVWPFIEYRWKAISIWKDIYRTKGCFLQNLLTL